MGSGGKNLGRGKGARATGAAPDLGLTTSTQDRLCAPSHPRSTPEPAFGRPSSDSARAPTLLEKNRARTHRRIARRPSHLPPLASPPAPAWRVSQRWTRPPAPTATSTGPRTPRSCRARSRIRPRPRPRRARARRTPRRGRRAPTRPRRSARRPRPRRSTRRRLATGRSSTRRARPASPEAGARSRSTLPAASARRARLPPGTRRPGWAPSPARRSSRASGSSARRASSSGACSCFPFASFPWLITVCTRRSALQGQGPAVDSRRQGRLLLAQRQPRRARTPARPQPGRAPVPPARADLGQRPRRRGPQERAPGSGGRGREREPQVGGQVRHCAQGRSGRPVGQHRASAPSPFFARTWSALTLGSTFFLYRRPFCRSRSCSSRSATPCTSSRARARTGSRCGPTRRRSARPTPASSTWTSRLARTTRLALAPAGRTTGAGGSRRPRTSRCGSRAGRCCCE